MATTAGYNSLSHFMGRILNAISSVRERLRQPLPASKLAPKTRRFPKAPNRLLGLRSSQRSWEDSITEFKAIIDREYQSRNEKPPEWSNLPPETDKSSEGVPAKPWPLVLAAKVDAESKRLQKQRFEANGYIEVPVTSIALQNFPVENAVLNQTMTNPILKQYREDAIPPGERIKKETMLKLGKVMRDMGQENTLFRRIWLKFYLLYYILQQFATWAVYRFFCIISLGDIDYREPGVWKQWAYRYPPIEGTCDLFNIRDTFQDAQRADNIVYMKRRVWFNPATGRHETVTFSSLDDETIFYDRFPGETDGIDPVEFGKYHHLSPQDAVVKWLGETIIKPAMSLFKFYVLFHTLAFMGMVIVSIGHMWLVEVSIWARI
ncbi:hypothetical protein TWF694_000213 [Orbilia ellipsospora]|uniref:Uncharacterized protein n=1 Tax=Orbilia ellipsospora TaxID=2528407 RepID=A0AAV9XMY6_9PEZI